MKQNFKCSLHLQQGNLVSPATPAMFVYICMTTLRYISALFSITGKTFSVCSKSQFICMLQSFQGVTLEELLLPVRTDLITQYLLYYLFSKTKTTRNILPQRIFRFFPFIFKKNETADSRQVSVCFSEANVPIIRIVDLCINLFLPEVCLTAKILPGVSVVLNLIVSLHARAYTDSSYYI